MAAEKSHLFVSYAKEDLDRVRPLVDAVRRELEFRALPVDLWMDLSNLRPGEAWNAAVAEGLQSSIGFLFFVSPHSLQSDWVRRELKIAAETSDRLIIPVLLYRPSRAADLPEALAVRQWLDFSSPRTQKDVTLAAERIAEATESYLKATPKPRAVISQAEAPVLAAELAQQIRASDEPATQAEPTAVFIVHGHDTEALAKLEGYLSSVGIAAVILSRQDE